MRRRRAVTFAKTSACLLLLALACSGAGTGDVREISPQELLSVLREPDASLVLDVRSAEEFAGGHVPGARNVEYDQVATRLDELGPAREVVVYCERGSRAAVASDALREAGFTVRHLTGDMSGWRAAGLPVEGAKSAMTASTPSRLVPDITPA